MKKMRKIMSLLLALSMFLSLLGTTAFAADFTKLKSTDGEVTLNGTDKGTVTVHWTGVGNDEYYAVEGDWSMKELESTDYLKLIAITSEVISFTGMNTVDLSNGHLQWVDDTLSNPGVLTPGKNLLSATYEVAADTPAGEYTVKYQSVHIAAADAESDKTPHIITPKIVVKRSDTPPTIKVVPIPTAKTGLVYTGSEQQGVPDGTGYTLTGHKATNAGTSYKATATLDSGYKWSDGTTTAKEISWSIAKANPTVTNPTGLTGTKGNALSTVTLPTGWAWKAPTTVMNETGTKTFAAVYTPTDTANYNTKEANLTVAVSEPPVTHPTKPTINVTGTYTYTGSDITATVTGYDSATMNIAGNVGKNAGDYTVSVTSKTGKWADGSTTAVTKAWSIAKANPTVTNPTGLTGTKGNALSTVTLPTGWAWKAPTTVMNETGAKTFAAIYTPTDTTNYNTKEANLTVAVSEPPVTHPTKPTINVTGTYTYTGSDITATVTGYDSATMNITGNVGKTAGSYTVSVTSKTGKWADGSTTAVTKAWNIAKANPTVTNPTGLTGTKGNALSTVTLPTGWAWKAPTTVMNETGTKTFAAIYTPEDITNYNTKEENLTVIVSEPPATHPAKPTINVTGTYTYTGSDITATVTGYDSATMNIAGNVGKNAGDYTVSVTSKTGKWADGSTTAVTKSWSIAKADPTVTVPTGLNGTKGNALSTVTLPTGWAWKAPTTVMNETGTKTFAAIYTPEDTTNYNTKEENLTVIVSESPAIDPAKPEIDVTGTYIYTGSDITATVTGYDSATMNITGNVGKNAGDYTVSVTSKTGKWADGTTDAVTKAWSVAKAKPTGNPKYTSITTTGKTLADAALTTTGADFSVPGTVKWIADDGSDLADTTAVAANTYYKWLFTPTDTINYETLTGNIRLYYKSSGGGGSRRTTRYTVTFEANGGSKITSQSVTKNTVAKEPTAPTKENFDFAGWYTDKEFKTKYDFSDKVTKSFTLYAKWTEKDNSANQIILTIGKKDAQVFGKTKSNDVAPKIEKDRTMLPARFVAENLGAKVEWDGEKELVTITGKNLKTDENVTILITIGAATAKVNGKEIKLDSPAFIENDRTYTPIRFISESLGASVEWIEKEQKVIITKPEIKKAETK